MGNDADSFFPARSSCRLSGSLDLAKNGTSLRAIGRPDPRRGFIRTKLSRCGPAASEVGARFRRPLLARTLAQIPNRAPRSCARARNASNGCCCCCRFCYCCCRCRCLADKLAIALIKKSSRNSAKINDLRRNRNRGPRRRPLVISLESCRSPIAFEHLFLSVFLPPTFPPHPPPPSIALSLFRGTNAKGRNIAPLQARCASPSLSLSLFLFLCLA